MLMVVPLGQDEDGGIYTLTSVMLVVPDVILIACCSMMSWSVGGWERIIMEYWMVLWIRNAIPPPIPPLSRSFLTMLYPGVLRLVREVSFVSCMAAIRMLCCSINLRIS